MKANLVVPEESQMEKMITSIWRNLVLFYLLSILFSI